MYYRPKRKYFHACQCHCPGWGPEIWLKNSLKHDFLLKKNNFWEENVCHKVSKVYPLLFWSQRWCSSVQHQEVSVHLVTLHHQGLGSPWTSADFIFFHSLKVASINMGLENQSEYLSMCVWVSNVMMMMIISCLLWNDFCVWTAKRIRRVCQECCLASCTCFRMKMSMFRRRSSCLSQGFTDVLYRLITLVLFCRNRS